MPRKSTAVTLFVAVCLASVFLVGAAGALSVSVTQEGSEVFVEVTEGGEPVEDAKVSVSGVTTETPLDGEYSTDEDGRVSFDDDDVAGLSGVIHLRISVEADGSYKSDLTTLTRSPEVESPPLGQRISVSLGRSVSETRGTVEGRMDAIRTNASQIRRTATHVDGTLERLGNVRFEREVLGRNLAAGDITASEFYIRRVEKTGESALLRSSLRETVEHLSAYGDERLREEGIDTVELEVIRDELNRGSRIDTNRRILEDTTEE